jgi:hypothetical protein
VKEVELQDVDGDVNIMFRLRNKNVPSALKQAIKPIELDEVEVKVLSKDSYDNLSQPEKNVYDNMTIRGRDGISVPPVRLGGNMSPNDGPGDYMDAFQAMKLAKDSGIEYISNEPAKMYKLIDKFAPNLSEMDIAKNKGRLAEQGERPKYKHFRAHADPLSKTIYLPGGENPEMADGRTPARKKYAKQLLAEASHMPKYENPYTNFKGWLHGLYKTITGKQKEMYSEPGNYEHYTHSVIEPKLQKKYTTRYKY